MEKRKANRVGDRVSFIVLQKKYKWLKFSFGCMKKMLFSKNELRMKNQNCFGLYEKENQGRFFIFQAYQKSHR
jgi:hypothetical protein